MLTIKAEEKVALTGIQAVGMGWCPLVLGECVQGRMDDGTHFLITSPIGLFCWAEFRRDPGEVGVTVVPEDRYKAVLAVRRYLAAEGLPDSGALRITSPVEPGQGFGTSTADIAASLRAAAAAWGRTISPERIARFAIGIEPTDGSMYPGCVAFAHREGILLESLGTLPPFDALVVCTGGMVDTVAFDEIRKDFRYSKDDQKDILRAWAMVRQANRMRDAMLMGGASTISACINEQLLRKPFFNEMLRYVECGGADGIMTAHSGTALALLFDPTQPNYSDRMVEARSFITNLRVPQWFFISNQTMYRNAALRCCSE